MPRSQWTAQHERRSGQVKAGLGELVRNEEAAELRHAGIPASPPAEPDEPDEPEFPTKRQPPEKPDLPPDDDPPEIDDPQPDDTPFPVREPPARPTPMAAERRLSAGGAALPAC